MKNTLLALALFAFVGSAAAHDNDGDGKAAKGKKDSCTGTAAAKCEKGMAGTKMDGMPACCRAKMAAKAAAATTTAAVKPATKSL